MGAQGYVGKGDDPRALVKAVRKVAAGDNFISPQLAEAVTFSGASIKANPASQISARELEILRLLGRGDKITEVADALDISYKTVANTTSLLKQKLGAKNHSDLIRIAVEMDLGLTRINCGTGLVAPDRRDRPYAGARFRRGNGTTKAVVGKGHSRVSVVTVMAPAVMVPAAPAPSIMVTPAAAVHVTVAVAMSAFHPNHGVVLRGKRRDPSLAEADVVSASVDAKQRDTNQNDAFQAVSSHRMIAISDSIFRLEFCSRYCREGKTT